MGRRVAADFVGAWISFFGLDGVAVSVGDALPYHVLAKCGRQDPVNPVHPV
jgi:hypothetical protein